MKKLPAFTLICFSFVFLFLLNTLSVNAQSQRVNDAYLLLSDYRYTAKDNRIGTIVIHETGDKSGKTGDFILLGANTDKFKIRGGNQLILRRKYAKSAEKWFDVGIGMADGQLKSDFKVLKDEFHTNGVIAHRGAWKNTGTPENSIAALREAVRLGCEGSEFDVHMTSDGVPVVNHDRDVQELEIEHTTFGRLSQVRLSNAEPVPTLAAFLEAGMEQNTTKLILEIKPSAVSGERGVQLAEQVVKMVREHKAEGWIDYISFDYEILKKVRELDPYARVAYLKGEKSPAEVAADDFWGLDYHFKVFQTNPDWIGQAKEAGLTLNAWTVNEPEVMDWFLEKGFDFITTNEPELLLKKAGAR